MGTHLLVAAGLLLDTGGLITISVDFALLVLAHAPRVRSQVSNLPHIDSLLLLRLLSVSSALDVAEDDVVHTRLTFLIHAPNHLPFATTI